MKLKLTGSAGGLDGSNKEREGSKMTARFLNRFTKRMELPLTEKIKAVEGTSLWEFDFTHLEFDINGKVQ